MLQGSALRPASSLTFVEMAMPLFFAGRCVLTSFVSQLGRYGLGGRRFDRPCAVCRENLSAQLSMRRATFGVSPSGSDLARGRSQSSEESASDNASRRLGPSAAISPVVDSHF